jgi:hypothetical protein
MRFSKAIAGSLGIITDEDYKVSIVNIILGYWKRNIKG